LIVVLRNKNVKDNLTAPRTVFVVDDDPQLREALEGLLNSVNLNVETFESPQVFLKAFDPARAGCLVLDVRMPGMSGLELQRTLVSQDVHIPTVILTSYADTRITAEALQAGALSVIEKPYSPQNLLDQIQQALASYVSGNETKEVG
jgi:FixJ family two-component response regulator